MIDHNIIYAFLLKNDRVNNSSWNSYLHNAIKLLHLSIIWTICACTFLNLIQYFQKAIYKMCASFLILFSTSLVEFCLLVLEFCFSQSTYNWFVQPFPPVFWAFQGIGPLNHRTVQVLVNLKNHKDTKVIKKFNKSWYLMHAYRGNTMWSMNIC